MFARREAELAAHRRRACRPRAIAIYAGDVRDAQALARAGGDFLARFGAPDVVIANAGVSRGTVTDFAEDMPAFAEVLDTNVLGIVHTFQPFIAAMRAARRGALVGIASVAGFRGLPGSGAYSASKAAAITYLESLRVELRGSGIAVVTVCPGYIATPMTAGNPYRMPFLMRPGGRRAQDRAARSRGAGVSTCCRGRWPSSAARLRWLPRPLLRPRVSRAPRSSRAGRLKESAAGARYSGTRNPTVTV